MNSANKDILSQKSRVYILGAGAMGCLYASYLLRNPELDVTLIVHDPECAALMNSKGIRISENGKEEQLQVHAVSSGTLLPPADLVILFIKTHQTESALSENQHIFASNTLTLSLQNGLSNITLLPQKFAPENLVVGISTHNSTRLSPGVFFHGANGRTVLGSLCGQMTTVHKAGSFFQNTGLAVEYTEDIRYAVWKKLFANLTINPLTFLFEVKNGMIAQNPELRRTAEQLVSEALTVASAEGVHFDKAAVIEHIFSVAENTGAGYSSMYQDRLNHRLTEIGEINGAIVDLAAKHHIPVPHNAEIVRRVRVVEATFKK